jgi:hypothetical protein
VSVHKSSHQILEPTIIRHAIRDNIHCVLPNKLSTGVTLSLPSQVKDVILLHEPRKKNQNMKAILLTRHMLHFMFLFFFNSLCPGWARHIYSYFGVYQAQIFKSHCSKSLWRWFIIQILYCPLSHIFSICRVSEYGSASFISLERTSFDHWTPLIPSPLTPIYDGSGFSLRNVLLPDTVFTAQYNLSIRPTFVLIRNVLWNPCLDIQTQVAINFYILLVKKG